MGGNQENGLKVNSRVCQDRPWQTRTENSPWAADFDKNNLEGSGRVNKLKAGSSRANGGRKIEKSSEK